MAFAFVQARDQSFAESGSARSLAYNSNVAAGNLLVAVVSTFNPGITVAVADSLGQTWSAANITGLAHPYSEAGDLQNRQSIWYFPNTGAGACSVTVTPSATAYVSIALSEFSGAATANVLGYVTAVAGASTSPNAGDTPLPESPCLTVGGYCFGSGVLASCTVGAPFTQRRNELDGTNFSAGSTADNVNALLAGSPLFTLSTSKVWTAIAASFRMPEKFWQPLAIPGWRDLKWVAPPRRPPTRTLAPESIAGVLWPETVVEPPPMQLFLGRDPKQDPRTRRFLDLLRQILNSFLRKHTISQTGVDTFGMAHLLFAGHGAPPESLAYPGCFYLDLDTGILYEKS